MRTLATLALLMLGACTDDSGSVPPCTGAVYDVCTTSDQCTSTNCKEFTQSGFSVCTQACTPGDNSTCPVDATGVNGTCNGMGICKPAAPTGCSR